MFTLTRSELRAGINRIIVVMALMMVPTGGLLLGSMLQHTGGSPRRCGVPSPA